MAWPENVTSFCVKAKRLAGGDADLLAHQVDAGDHLGHRMLDLQARVHLDEVELAVLVEELDGADAAVAELLHARRRRRRRCACAASALRAGEGASSNTFWWRRCSEQSRSPRWTTLPLPSPTTWISMWRGLLQVLLDVDAVVAEGGLGLGARRPKALSRSSGGRTTFMPRPPPPAAALISTGKPICPAALRACASLAIATPPSPARPGCRPRGRRLGRDLVAHQPDVLGRRADEDDAVLLDDLGEVGVLRQEAVARMDGVGAGDLAGRQQGRDVEVALRRRRRADAHALVGEAHVHRVGVGGRVHRDGGDAQLPAGAQDAQRDLAAVGDQDLLEHRAGRLSAATR